MEQVVPNISSTAEDSDVQANPILGEEESFSSYEASSEEQSEDVSQGADLSSEERSPRPEDLKLKQEKTQTMARDRFRNRSTSGEIERDAEEWAAGFQGGQVTSTSWTKEEADPRRDQSKKRKKKQLDARSPKSKRLKGLYNDEYRQLLNGDIQDAVSQTLSEGYETLPESQIGMTIWTSQEKENLFAALGRLGKDDVRGISSRIGSKSELEVRQYIQLLHQGVVKKTIQEPRQELLGFVDMPAAVQISQDCCDALNNAADSLAIRQDRHEEQEEQKKWGHSWLLNSEVNRSIEEQLEDDGDGLNIRDILPSAELLNLGNWLELSRRIFMNPGAPFEDENWENVADPDEEPAIRATAFGDFHNLATIITQRLVSATLFCAMSRLRSMDPKSFTRDDVVRRTDVEAAVKIIGLKANSKKFWTGCPRRCHLQVYRTLTSSRKGRPPMNYGEVEEILNREKIPRDLPDGTGDESAEFLSERSRATSADLDDSTSPSESEAYSKSHSPTKTPRDLGSEYIQAASPKAQESCESADTSRRRHSFQSRAFQATLSQEAQDRAQEEYAEAIDLQASLMEEQKLWDILDQDPPFTIKPDEISVPDYPRLERKGEEDVRDWRDQMRFWSSWEVFDRPLPVAAFERGLERRSGDEDEDDEDEDGDEEEDGNVGSGLLTSQDDGDESEEGQSESENSPVEDGEEEEDDGEDSDVVWSREN